jgi:hypothetical protein
MECSEKRSKHCVSEFKGFESKHQSYSSKILNKEINNSFSF